MHTVTSPANLMDVCSRSVGAGEVGTNEAQRITETLYCNNTYTCCDSDLNVNTLPTPRGPLKVLGHELTSTSMIYCSPNGSHSIKHLSNHITPRTFSDPKVTSKLLFCSNIPLGA